MTKKPKESGYSTDPSHPLYDATIDPNHPSYDRDKADSVAKSDSSNGNTYKVGPGFPPNEHKWKKGCPSPYPKGRPRKVPSMKPDVKKAFEDAIFGKVPVNKGDKKVQMAMITIGLQKLAVQFANGDRYARRDVFQYAVLLGVDLQAKDVVAEALGLSDQAIVESYVRRRLQQSAEASPEVHVKAPPDLLDDDVASSDSHENPVNSPQPDTHKKSPEPFLDEHGTPLSVSDPRYIQALRERNIAQQKKNQEES